MRLTDAPPPCQRSHDMIPPSPYLDYDLIDKIHKQTQSSRASDSHRIQRLVRTSLDHLSISKLPTPHVSRHGGIGSLETDSMEVFERNVRLYGKRDRVDSLRWLWCGEGEVVSWSIRRKSGWKGTTRSAGEASNGTGTEGGRSLGKLVGRVKSLRYVFCRVLVDRHCQKTDVT